MTGSSSASGCAARTAGCGGSERAAATADVDAGCAAAGCAAIPVGATGAGCGAAGRGAAAVAVAAGVFGIGVGLSGAGIAFPGAAIAAPGPCSSEAPHMPQKRCVSGFSLPQCGQRTAPPQPPVPNRLRYLTGCMQRESTVGRRGCESTRSPLVRWPPSPAFVPSVAYQDTAGSPPLSRCANSL